MTSRLQPDAPDRQMAPNRVGSLEFRFDVSDASRQLGAPEKLLMAVRAELLDIVDSTLTEAASGKNNIRLEHIDISLGTFPDPPDWQQVRATLRERLLAELTPYLYPVAATPGAVKKQAREPGANLPNVPSTDPGADASEVSSRPADPVTRISTNGTHPPDTTLPEFTSKRQKPGPASTITPNRLGSAPQGKGTTQPTGPDQVTHGDNREHPARRAPRLAPIQKVPSENTSALSPENGGIPQDGDIVETLHNLASGTPNAEGFTGILTKLRWRHRHSAARLHEELAALSSRDLAHLSALMNAGTDPEPGQFAGQKASLSGEASAPKTDLIKRIKHALEDTAPRAPDKQRVAVLTTVLRGLIPDTLPSPPDTQWLANVAKSAMHLLSEAATSDLVRQHDPKLNNIRCDEDAPPPREADLSRMNGADLRELIDRLLPENATQLSAAIDQPDTTAADLAAALRTEAQALLTGRPVDSDHILGAAGEGTYEDDAAAIAIVALLRALNASELEIAAFLRQRFAPMAHRDVETEASTRYEDQSKPSLEPRHRVPTIGSTFEGPATSGFEPETSTSATQLHGQPGETSPRGHAYTDGATPDAATGAVRGDAQASRPSQPVASGESGASPSDTSETPRPDRAEVDSDRIGTSKATGAIPVFRRGDASRDHSTFVPDKANSPTHNGDDQRGPDPRSVPQDETGQEGLQQAKISGPADDTDAAGATNPVTGPGSTPDAPAGQVSPSVQPKDAATIILHTSATTGKTGSEKTAAEDASKRSTDAPLPSEAVHRPDLKRTLDTRAGTGETPSDRIPDRDTPPEVSQEASDPHDNEGTASTDSAEEATDTQLSNEAAPRDVPEGTETHADTDPDTPPAKIPVGQPEGSGALAPEGRLNALLDAAAPTGAPRLRQLFDLIWSAIPDGTAPAIRDRTRYWHAALAAVLSPPKGQLTQEHAVASFLTVIEPDESARHNLLRVLLARLEYGRPGTDPVLRQETCRAIERLLASDRSSPITRPAAITDIEPDARFVTTTCAGLVIFHPYLPMLFDRMALLSPAKHILPGQLPRAAAALASLADAASPERPPDPLERLMLALPDAAELAPEILSDSDISLIDSLLRSVIAQWPRLGQTSPSGLRAAFICRTGMLQTDGDTPRLLVDDGPYDMLLDGLPWALSPVALPWMTAPLTVIWRQSDD